MGHAMQRMVNRKWFLNTVIRKGGKSEDLTRILTGMIEDQRSRRKLFSPLFYLRLLMA